MELIDASARSSGRFASYSHDAWRMTSSIRWHERTVPYVFPLAGDCQSVYYELLYVNYHGHSRQGKNAWGHASPSD